MPDDKPTSKVWIIWVGVAVAVILVGYALYELLIGNTQASLNTCEQNYKTAFAEYMKQYDAFLNANKGQPLTQQQEASLQPFVTQMNNAEACVQTLGASSIAGFYSTITIIGGLVVASFTFSTFYKIYLGKKGQFVSGSQQRAAARDSDVQERVNNGTMDADAGAANVNATQDAVANEAESEVSALDANSQAIIDLALQANDLTLVDATQEFQMAIDTETEASVEDVTTYFLSAFGI